MAYGYKEWLEHEGKDDEGNPVNPEMGAYEKVLQVVENLKYPQSGWGMIHPEGFVTHIKGLMTQDGRHEGWDSALENTLKIFEEGDFGSYPGGRIDPKNLVSAVKKKITERKKAES